MQTVKDLSVEELRAVIGEVAEEKLREILNDPDAGLTLRPGIRERLGGIFRSLKRRARIFLRPNWLAVGVWIGRCINLRGFASLLSA